MHSNIARAYDCLRDEHDRVRAACVQILSQNDKSLERELLRANLNDPKHHDEMLLFEGAPVATSAPTSGSAKSAW
jgi:hypothetical protein